MSSDSDTEDFSQKWPTKKQTEAEKGVKRSYKVSNIVGTHDFKNEKSGRSLAKAKY